MSINSTRSMRLARRRSLTVPKVRASCSANSWAVSRPIPDEAPVTNATVFVVMFIVIPKVSASIGLRPPRVRGIFQSHWRGNPYYFVRDRYGRRLTLERDPRQQPCSLFQRNILSIFPNGGKCVGVAGPCAHVYWTRRVYIDIRVCGH